MATSGRTRLRGTYTARVLANRPVCPDHYLLRLGLERFPPSGAGQFVNVRCGPVAAPAGGAATWGEGGWPRLGQPELTARRPLLRRPFGIAGRLDGPDGTVALDIIHHVVGVGTALLARLAAGAEVNVLGPLGRGFAVLADRPAAVLIAGGVGIAPLLYLAETLRSAGKAAVAFAGARTARQLPLTVNPGEPPSPAGRPTTCAAEFAARGTPAVIATDDGSLGAAGMIHESFVRWLEGQDADRLAAYACGPEPMMKAVADACRPRRIPCQLALERHMACGMGTCQGCVVKVKSEAPPGWRFKLACNDGPVFDAEELLWEVY